MTAEKVEVTVDGDVFTLATEGGSVKVCDLGNGKAIVGEWDCDGSNPHAAVALYKSAESLCEREGFVPVVFKSPGEDWSVLERLGWEVKAVVLGRKQDGI